VIAWEQNARGFSILTLGLVGVGVLIRSRMERPVRFIGHSAEPDSSSAFATLPLDFGQTRAAVFDARHHKQEV
jgi:hypothetical protein